MPVTDLVLLAAVYLVAVNVLGAAVFAWDKYCARRELWRVPERTLLTIAAAGGTIGSVVAARTLRHKTYKEPFRTYLRLIATVQVIVLLAVCALLIWRWLGQASTAGA